MLIPNNYGISRLLGSQAICVGMKGDLGADLPKTLTDVFNASLGSTLCNVTSLDNGHGIRVNNREVLSVAPGAMTYNGKNYVIPHGVGITGMDVNRPDFDLSETNLVGLLNMLTSGTRGPMLYSSTVSSKNYSTLFMPQNSAIEYTFEVPVKLTNITVRRRTSANATLQMDLEYKLSGSEDWTSLGSVTTGTSDSNTAVSDQLSIAAVRIVFKNSATQTYAGFGILFEGAYFSAQPEPNSVGHVIITPFTSDATGVVQALAPSASYFGMGLSAGTGFATGKEAFVTKTDLAGGEVAAPMAIVIRPTILTGEPV